MESTFSFNSNDGKCFLFPPETAYRFSLNLHIYSIIIDKLLERGVRDVAQLGSALPWGGRGHGFESHRSDH